MTSARRESGPFDRSSSLRLFVSNVARGKAVKLTQSYGDTVDRSKFLSNTEDVQQTLSRVLSDTVTSVDDGDGTGLGCALTASNLWVSEDNCVRITSDSSDRVGQRLSLDNGRGRSSDRNHFSSTSFHGSLERGRSSGAWLVEEGTQDTALECVNRSSLLDLVSDLRSQVEQDVQVISAELFDAQDVSSRECSSVLE